MKNHDYDWAPDEVKDLLVHVKGKLCIRCRECGTVRITQGREYVLGAAGSLQYCRAHRNDSQGRFSRDEVSSWPEGHKKCNRCLHIKCLSEFHSNPDGLYGVMSRCKVCRNELIKRKDKSSWLAAMVSGARWRAAKRGLPFDISEEDITIPTTCPILGVPIEQTKGSPYAPSLDRIVPELGYIQGNVQVVSLRANVIKSNMTLDEARRVATWFEQNSHSG